MVALGRSPNGGSHGPPARPGATTFPTAWAPTVRPARILVSTLPTVRQLTKTLPNARQPSSAIAMDIISRIPGETLQARSLSRAVWGITVRSASNREAIPPPIERIARSFFHFFEGIFPERSTELPMHTPADPSCHGNIETDLTAICVDIDVSVPQDNGGDGIPRIGSNLHVFRDDAKWRCRRLDSE